MAKHDNADFLQIQRDMLKMTGAWPEETSTLLYKAKGIFIYVISLILGVTMLMEAYQDLDDFVNLSEILYIMVMVISYIFKHASVFRHHAAFVEMLRFLGDPIFSSYPDDMDYLMARRIRITRILANSYRTLVFTGVVMLTLYPFIDNKPLPFPFPYELGKYRYFMFVFQVIGIATNAWNNLCLDCVVVNLMGITATQLEILSGKLAKIKEACEVEAETEWEGKQGVILGTLKEIVQHHLAIMRLVTLIEQVFSMSILFQFIGSVIIICNTVFHFALVPAGSSQFFTLTNYLINIMLQLFMYCWFGNEVILKSANVGRACYFFNWYNCGKEVRKHLLFIMERTERPLKITAYNFSSLSLTAFSSIMQWSYSYYALLMKMYNKKLIQND